MAKTAIEKQIEKQTKENKKLAQQEAQRLRAASIVSGQPLIGGMRIIDATAEIVLKCLIDSCKNRETGLVNFDLDIFPRNVQNSLSLEIEKLLQYGMVSGQILWMTGGRLYLLSQAFSYFDDKEKSLNERNVVVSQDEYEKNEVKEMNKRVFIVHGHDSEAKEVLARTLEKAGFEAIILHEQADGGRTIIEKIEEYTDVCFAVVLYTECDLGRAKEQGQNEERYRARQNVVFEHGYLIGKLSRKRVCAMVKGDVETPGDISGVLYTPMDQEGAWKLRLAKNMKEAGIDIDLNKWI